MLKFSHADFDFLGNDEIIGLLISVIAEINRVASAGAYRSTTYLAASVIEGLFIEIIRLFGFNQDNTKNWPTKQKNVYKLPEDLLLDEATAILKKHKKLPQDFDMLYDSVRNYRNYIHPARELRNLKDLTPIDQSVACLALACLSKTIEEFRHLRVFSGCIWRLNYGNARVRSNSHIETLDDAANPVRQVILVCEALAGSLQEMQFRVHVPSGAIFNFVYNYFSTSDFMGARIEGRTDYQGGRIRCATFGRLTMESHYVKSVDPDPDVRSHDVLVRFAPRLEVRVDQKILLFEDRTGWEFDPRGGIGFMTERGNVVIEDLVFQKT